MRDNGTVLQQVGTLVKVRKLQPEPCADHNADGTPHQQEQGRQPRWSPSTPVEHPVQRTLKSFGPLPRSLSPAFLEAPLIGGAQCTGIDLMGAVLVTLGTVPSHVYLDLDTDRT